MARVPAYLNRIILEICYYWRKTVEFESRKAECLPEVIGVEVDPPQPSLEIVQYWNLRDS